MVSLLGNWLESLSYEIAVADNCLRKISPFSTCIICQEICEQQAITYKNGSLEINDKICNGCSRCITICPVSALQGQSPPRKTLNGVLILDEGPLPTNNELLYLYKSGIQKIFLPMSETKVEEIIKETNALLTQMNMDPFEIGPVPEPVIHDSPKLSRREFFSKLSLESKKLASTVTPVKWRFNQDRFHKTGMFEGWSFFTIELDKETCTLCETCFRLCSSNVFHIEDDLLKIDSEKCTGCSLCSDVCKYGAVKVVPGVSESEFVNYAIVKSKCTSCGSDFLGWKNTDSCTICESSKKTSILNFL
ncbi:MAG: 4Fe-4S binding protein [Bacillus sp. (in: Bacteria)]|nr:4Fe-4S binding protein [Bacillus sp. (in: firmicutes)]